jgi:hypothetical protein
MKAEVSMPALMRQSTLQAVVTGVRRTKIRIWLGSKLLVLAAAVMGCGIEVDIR